MSLSTRLRAAATRAARLGRRALAMARPRACKTCGETLALRECSACGALVCPEHRTRMGSLPNDYACDDGSCWLPR
jgi:hypothetical protein